MRSESGRVEVDLGRRELLVHAVPATIGERAFDIFALSKDDIRQGVWSGVVVRCQQPRQLPKCPTGDRQ